MVYDAQECESSLERLSILKLWNNIEKKILKDIGIGVIKFSSWKLDSITSSMRLNYKNLTYEI